jgi:hypothetical protein
LLNEQVHIVTIRLKGLRVFEKGVLRRMFGPQREERYHGDCSLSVQDNVACFTHR